MDIYTIKRAYPDCLKGNEIEITSDNLIYSELENLNGAQSISIENNEKIIVLCGKVADLIRVIDKLNKS